VRLRKGQTETWRKETRRSQEITERAWNE